MLFFYHLLMFGFSFSIRIASLWSEKARLWIRGRKNIFENMQYEIDPGKGPIIWMHCASLGEFEQGRPVLEALRKEYPHIRILLTFFSPSGYEVRKNTTLADWVFYLPLDGKRNANRFLDIVQPHMAIFVKYESWFHYLYALKKRGIPSLLISAFFRKEQNFFGVLGGLLRKMLDLYDIIFVQDEISAELLKKYNIKTLYVIAGDTRFDRVLELSGMDFHHNGIEKFVSDSKLIVAGSTWKEDEDLLMALHQSDPTLKFIIAPHEIHEKHLTELKLMLPDSILLSDIERGKEIRDEKILLVDCFGILSKLYRLGTVCYVGGGFNKAGIHNILEAAAYGKVVFFGPNHKRTAEAGMLITNKAGFCVDNADQFIGIVKKMIAEPTTRLQSEKAALDFISASKGATKDIIRYVSQNLNSFH
jgi:3-deoxy-D-manno-octulosonic-acid transferase